MKRICWNCRWWWSTGSHGQENNPAYRLEVDKADNTCVRHSPIYNEETGRLWPETYGDDRCGDWEKWRDETLRYNLADAENAIECHRVKDCGFSARASNRLAWGGISTLHDLSTTSKRDLLKIRHFGEMCFYEIKRYIESCGIDWLASVQAGSVVLIDDKA